MEVGYEEQFPLRKHGGSPGHLEGLENGGDVAYGDMVSGHGGDGLTAGDLRALPQPQ